MLRGIDVECNSEGGRSVCKKSLVLKELGRDCIVFAYSMCYQTQCEVGNKEGSRVDCRSELQRKLHNLQRSMTLNKIEEVRHHIIVVNEEKLDAFSGPHWRQMIVFFNPISIVFQFIIVVSLFCTCSCSKKMLQKTSIIKPHFRNSNLFLIFEFCHLPMCSSCCKNTSFFKMNFPFSQFGILGKLTSIIGSNHDKLWP
jgi:hypothetical protein